MKIPEEAKGKLIFHCTHNLDWNHMEQFLEHHNHIFHYFVTDEGNHCMAIDPMCLSSALRILWGTFRVTFQITPILKLVEPTEEWGNGKFGVSWGEE